MQHRKNPAVVDATMDRMNFEALADLVGESKDEERQLMMNQTCH